MTDLDTAHIAEFCKALGQPTRLKIIWLLSQGELDVGVLGTALGYPKGVLFSHLRLLLDIGIVGKRKEGHEVFYYLLPQDNAVCAGLLSALLAPMTPLPKPRQYTRSTSKP